MHGGGRMMRSLARERLFVIMVARLAGEREDFSRCRVYV